MYKTQDLTVKKSGKTTKNEQHNVSQTRFTHSDAYVTIK